MAMDKNAEAIVTIEELERATYARDHASAGTLLMRLLAAMASEQGQFTRGEEQATLGFDEELRVLTRVAGAMLCILADPKMRMSQEGYEALSMFGGQVSSLFELSGYRGAEHVWRLLAKHDPQGQVVFGEDELRKAYALASPTFLPTELIHALRQMPKAIAVPALLGMLSRMLVLTKAANENRNLLLGMGDLLDGFHMTDVLAGNIAMPYMYCSYSDQRDKHEIKRHINRALQAWMARKNIVVPAPKGSGSAKPRMGVVMEFARIQHAMLRCYKGFIESLRERFHLVGISAPDQTDDATRLLFDEMLDVRAPVEVKPFLTTLVEARLDALYFPSVGMQAWAIWASNQRIAPLQFMSLGHPATSHSPQMDFVLTSGGIDFDPTCFSEKVVIHEGSGTPFDLLPESLATSPVVRRNPDVLRIAVPAKLFKLSADFLDACAEVARRAERPIEFHFFPNEVGALHHLARQRVEEALPNVRTMTYPRAPYAAYLRNLDACDIALGGFVFGNTNGAVDCLVRAIPIVALDGPEIHQGSEQILMRPVGLPEWLIAKSVSEYVDAVVRLVNNDDERVALSEALVGRTEAFLKTGAGRNDGFADAVWWMYQNRDALLAREEQVLHPPKTV